MEEKQWQALRSEARAQEEQLVCASTARARQAATELAAQKVEEDNANRVKQFVAVHAEAERVAKERHAAEVRQALREYDASTFTRISEARASFGGVDWGEPGAMELVATQNEAERLIKEDQLLELQQRRALIEARCPTSRRASTLVRSDLPHRFAASHTGLPNLIVADHCGAVGDFSVWLFEYVRSAKIIRKSQHGSSRRRRR